MESNFGYVYVQAGDKLVKDILPGGEMQIAELIASTIRARVTVGTQDTTYRKQSIATTSGPQVLCGPRRR
jgi:hypothetical protein